MHSVKLQGRNTTINLYRGTATINYAGHHKHYDIQGSHRYKLYMDTTNIIYTGLPK
jgi:hypothetical protein